MAVRFRARSGRIDRQLHTFAPKLKPETTLNPKTQTGDLAPRTLASICPSMLALAGLFGVTSLLQS